MTKPGSKKTKSGSFEQCLIEFDILQTYCSIKLHPISGQKKSGFVNHPSNVFIEMVNNTYLWGESGGIIFGNQYPISLNSSWFLVDMILRKSSHILFGKLNKNNKPNIFKPKKKRSAKMIKQTQNPENGILNSLGTQFILGRLMSGGKHFVELKKYGIYPETW